ncbi:MAG TPA: hypothetical protein VLR46_10580, partial [Candidatus Dormibacteraeota bacterium]|nr:hypothetical protein [Candidatus Dormibacteraeota bacterium]
MLFGDDALLLGRRTYEGLSAAYTKMAHEAGGVPIEFVDRMNSSPEYVASRTLREATWNATVIEGDDATLMEHGLVDEFHLLVTPVAIGKGQHLFEDIDFAPQL